MAAVLLCDCLCQIRRHDRCNKGRLFGHRMCQRSLAENVLADQHAGHISRKGNVFAGLRILGIDAETIRIRIRCKNNICVLFLCKLQCQRKGLRILRVRILQSREIRIGILLLRNHINMLEAKLFQNSRHRNQACSMERCIDNADIIRHLPDDLRMDDLLLEGFHVSVIDFSAEIDKKSLLRRFLLRHGLHLIVAGDRIDIRDDACVMRRCHLSAVLPVYLVAIVFRRIVACRDLYTGLASEIPKRKGFLRNRAKRVGKICLDSVCRKAKCRLFRKFRTHTAAVIGNGNALLRISVLIDVIGKALRRLTNGIDVHPVGACADHTAQSAGTKSEVLIKTILYFLLVITYRKQFFLGLLIKIRIAQPVIQLLRYSFQHGFTPP